MERAAFRGTGFYCGVLSTGGKQTQAIREIQSTGLLALLALRAALWAFNAQALLSGLRRDDELIRPFMVTELFQPF